MNKEVFIEEKCKKEPGITVLRFYPQDLLTILPEIRRMASWARLKKKIEISLATGTITPFIKSILKSLVILARWLALSGVIYSRFELSFALNCIFFSANENGTVKQNNQSDFKAFLN